jgi:CheY-like chemotaxis protein
MGGTIWVESEPGKGSPFYFTVDVALAPAAQPASECAAQLSGLSVLIVDDNATQRAILSEVVSAAGMLPVEAATAAEALRHLEAAAEMRTPFALALLDCRMPGPDSFALAEQIRQNELFSGTAIVMLTSAGQRGDASRCRALGITAYLTKPVSPFQLIRAMGLALGRKTEPLQATHLITRHSLPADPNRLRILLAEDNLVNQQVARRMLEKQNQTVTVVGSGREVLTALEQHSFDLILMDMQMPDMDGLQATAAIRRREVEGQTRIPIIALTANAMAGDRERCIQAGMDGYVTKPIRSLDLLNEIKRVRAEQDQREKASVPQIS